LEAVDPEPLILLEAVSAERILVPPPDAVVGNYPSDSRGLIFLIRPSISEEENKYEDFNRVKRLHTLTLVKWSDLTRMMGWMAF